MRAASVGSRARMPDDRGVMRNHRSQVITQPSSRARHRDTRTTPEAHQTSTLRTSHAEAPKPAPGLSFGRSFDIIRHAFRTGRRPYQPAFPGKVVRNSGCGRKRFRQPSGTATTLRISEGFVFPDRESLAPHDLVTPCRHVDRRQRIASIPVVWRRVRPNVEVFMQRRQRRGHRPLDTVLLSERRVGGVREFVFAPSDSPPETSRRPGRPLRSHPPRHCTP